MKFICICLAALLLLSVAVAQEKVEPVESRCVVYGCSSEQCVDSSEADPTLACTEEYIPERSCRNQCSGKLSCATVDNSCPKEPVALEGYNSCYETCLANANGEVPVKPPTGVTECVLWGCTNSKCVDASSEEANMPPPCPRPDPSNPEYYCQTECRSHHYCKNNDDGTCVSESYVKDTFEGCFAACLEENGSIEPPSTGKPEPPVTPPTSVCTNCYGECLTEDQECQELAFRPDGTRESCLKMCRYQNTACKAVEDGTCAPAGVTANYQKCAAECPEEESYCTKCNGQCQIFGPNSAPCAQEEIFTARPDDADKCHAQCADRATSCASTATAKCAPVKDEDIYYECVKSNCDQVQPPSEEVCWNCHGECVGEGFACSRVMDSHDGTPEGCKQFCHDINTKCGTTEENTCGAIGLYEERVAACLKECPTKPIEKLECFVRGCNGDICTRHADLLTICQLPPVSVHPVETEEPKEEVIAEEGSKVKRVFSEDCYDRCAKAAGICSANAANTACQWQGEKYEACLAQECGVAQEPEPVDPTCIRDGKEVPVYNCLVDPCRVSSCPAYPNAVCTADYCGRCGAIWTVGSADVTDSCNTRPCVNLGCGECAAKPGCSMCYGRLETAAGQVPYANCGPATDDDLCSVKGIELASAPEDLVVDESGISRCEAVVDQKPTPPPEVTRPPTDPSVLQKTVDVAREGQALAEKFVVVILGFVRESLDAETKYDIYKVIVRLIGDGAPSAEDEQNLKELLALSLSLTNEVVADTISVQLEKVAEEDEVKRQTASATTSYVATVQGQDQTTYVDEQNSSSASAVVLSATVLAVAFVALLF